MDKSEKYFSKYLYKFADKKINCLNIGAYDGIDTSWMLNNLCNNQNYI